ncbi:MAG: hypothetical protein Q9160_006028 [Pyrenula sp. 1 TL-2023]
MRTALASKFSSQAVLSFEKAVDNCIGILEQELSRRLDQVLDLEKWLQFWTSDVAAETSLGQRIGFMEQDCDVRDMIQGLRGGFRYAAAVGQVPAAHAWLIGNRRLVDFVTKFLGFPDPPGEYIAVDLAGGGTVSVTLGAIFYHLMKSPSAYQKLRNEIDHQDQKGLLSPIPSHEQTLAMPYLGAVLKEAMRLCPITTLPLERIVPDGGVEIGGHHVPAGTKIGVTAPAIHSNPEIFGQDVAQFRPERWLEGDAAQIKVMEKCFFGARIQWSKGSRACLGKGFALLQMRKLVTQMVRRFDFEWASSKPDWELKYYWVTEQHGLLARFKQREVLHVAASHPAHP